MSGPPTALPPALTEEGDHMKRLRLIATGAAAAAALALAMPAGSPAATTAKWLSYPTCTATSSSITCTGKAAGLRDDDVAPRIWVWGFVKYTCSDDPSVFGSTGEGTGEPLFVGPAIKNGRAFTTTYTPPADPWARWGGDSNLGVCPSGIWIRDPSYYFVEISVVNGFIAGVEKAILGASIGTVTPLWARNAPVRHSGR
jgi:hypothetical protein